MPIGRETLRSALVIRFCFAVAGVSHGVVVIGVARHRNNQIFIGRAVSVLVRTV